MKNKIVTVTFLIMLGVFAAVLLLPADEESILAENRVMSTLPPLDRGSLLSGGAESAIEGYVGDSVGKRGLWTRLSKRFDSIKGITPQTGSVISSTKDIGTGTTQKLTLLLIDRTVMEMFTKKNDAEKMYIDAVNHYAEKLPREVRLFNMIIPTQLEFREPMYKNLQDSQTEAVEEMYSMLDDSVTAVNVSETLGAHSDEYLYFRTDHHWTSLGAYYAYREFMRAEGGNAVNKEEFEKNEIKNVLGYLYNRVDQPQIAETPDTIEWYDLDPNEHITVKTHDLNEDGGLDSFNGVLYDRTAAGYIFFFGGDHPILEITNSDLKDGKTIAVIKDSYANVFVPWLAKSYKKVIVIDPRYYLGDFSLILDEYEPQEILIMNYIFTTNFPDYCNVLKKMYE